LTAGVIAGADPLPLAVLTAFATLVAFQFGVLTQWHVLLGVVVAIILFVPIRRYGLAADLPFDLELYRIGVALLVALWLSALLIDPEVRLRGTPVDGPLILFAFAVLGSIVTGTGLIERLGLASNVLKDVLFLASFYLVFYLIASVVRGRGAIDAVIKTLVAGGAAIAVFSLIEARAGYNVFDQLERIFPFLSFQGGLDEEGIARGVRLRVYASAEHPIALAAVLAMLLPLALYLGRSTGRLRWWIAGGVMTVAVFATVSRTGIVMLGVVTLLLLKLRPSDVKPLFPLVAPVFVVIFLLLPGTFGTFRATFFPAQGFVADQQVGAGRLSSERLGPQFEIIRNHPVFGQGYGTRITTGNRYACGEGLETCPNAKILDNEWLGTTVETGIVGLVAWLWFFIRFVRRTGREAASDPTSRGLLLACIASAVAAFAVSMLTLDGFSFIQATFVLFILAGLGMSILRSDDWPSDPRGPERGASRFRSSPSEAS
ncbi:MAG: O-antigen ligase family protein, partial [Actinobacteria bacterium]|nr:O-antigen ligase family protein [Actinomycetota bacterium]